MPLEGIECNYEVLDLIGKGGMAAVYRGVDRRTGRPVAIKVMDVSEQGGDREELVVRFEREALLTTKIDTPHIVRVHDAGRDPITRTPFMVMDLLQGEDLKTLLRRVGPLRPDVALRIVAQACAGIVQAHAAGVIHRDIKPGNLFLAEEAGQIVVKLLDFGIAKGDSRRGDTVDETHANTLTHTGLMLGSPHYMSPEQALGRRDIDARTDLWSLGIVLYKCLTGRTPYEQHEAIGQLVFNIVSEPVPPVQNHAPWAPPECAEVVDRALQRRRDARYESASAMLAALNALLPQGTALDLGMLSPLSAVERGSVQPRHSAPPDAAQPSGLPSVRRPASSVTTEVTVGGDTLPSNENSASRPRAPPARRKMKGRSGWLAGFLVVGVAACPRGPSPT
jgi:serine/threonine-protein kinase